MKSFRLGSARLAMAVCCALVALCGAASAASRPWAPGWDIFNEPLDLANSSVAWTVNQPNKLVTITVKLRGATPTKLYQFGLHLFCKNFPAQFGQFPFTNGPGTCAQITREGVTRSIAAVELGAILTDISGDGDAKVVVGPVVSRTYKVQFHIRNGAGCNVAGGGGNGTCPMVFQAPSPFGTVARIKVN